MRYLLGAATYAGVNRADRPPVLPTLGTGHCPTRETDARASRLGPAALQPVTNEAQKEKGAVTLIDASQRSYGVGVH